MKNHTPKTLHGRSKTRTGCLCGAMIALLLFPVSFSAGCDDTTSQQFRAAALDGIQTGLSAIFDGILNGVFAVAAGDAENSGGTTNDTADTTTDSTTG